MKEKDYITSIRCKRTTIKKLRELEKHHRETNEEIILRLMNGRKNENIS